MVLLKSDTGAIEDCVQPIPLTDRGVLELRVQTSPDGAQAGFAFRQGESDWQTVGEPLSTEILTDEHCRGFTGAHVGLYAHDMAGLGAFADFDDLAVHFHAPDHS